MSLMSLMCVYIYVAVIDLSPIILKCKHDYCIHDYMSCSPCPGQERALNWHSP